MGEAGEPVAETSDGALDDLSAQVDAGGGRENEERCSAANTIARTRS